MSTPPATRPRWPRLIGIVVWAAAVFAVTWVLARLLLQNIRGGVGTVPTIAYRVGILGYLVAVVLAMIASLLAIFDGYLEHALRLLRRASWLTLIVFVGTLAVRLVEAVR